jgi:hypothetical protein
VAQMDEAALFNSRAMVHAEMASFEGFHLK